MFITRASGRYIEPEVLPLVKEAARERDLAYHELLTQLFDIVDNDELVRRGTQKVKIPNAHRGDIGQALLKRILTQAGISVDDWVS